MERKVPFKLGIHHIGIVVSNMDTSIKWYEEMLGFSLAHRNDYDLPNQGIVDMAWLKNGDYYIELYEYEKEMKPFDLPEYFNSLGTKHVCFTVKHEEFPVIKKHLEDKGVRIPVDVRWPHDQKSGPIKPLPSGTDPAISHGVLYITDPDDIWIEIEEEYYPGIGPELK